MSKMFIKIGNCPLVIAAVRAALTQAGYSIHSKPRDLIADAVESYGDRATICCDNGKKFACYAYWDFYVDERDWRNYARYDATTDLNGLLNFLSVPGPVTIKQVITDSRGATTDAEVSPDGKTVKVGCSEATFEKVEEVYLAMKGAQK